MSNKERMLGEAQRDLGDTMMSLIGGKQLNKSTLQKAEEFVKFHREKWRKRGVDFPELVVLPIVNLNGEDFIELNRRDLSEKDIQTVVLNLTVKYPDITPQHIVFAIKHAWPSIKPFNLQMQRTGVKN